MQASPVAISRTEQHSLIDINDPEDQNKIRAFAKQNFKTLDGTGNSRNTVKLYTCCTNFCSKGYTPKLPHRKERVLTYAYLKGKYNFTCEEGFGEALITVLKEMASAGQKVYSPSYNCDHFESEDEPEDILPQKKLIVQEGDDQTSLFERLKEQEKEIEELKRQNEEQKKKLAKNKKIIEQQHHMLTEYEVMCKDFVDSIEFHKTKLSMTDTLMYHCENCKKNLSSDSIKAV